jgi:hypothetical protein
VEHTKLDFAVNRAEAPDVDDFESFASWSRGQESCSVAVACAVARMLRLLQAAGACPGLRETLQAAAASDRGAAAPLHVLLDGVRAHGPQDWFPVRSPLYYRRNWLRVYFRAILRRLAVLLCHHKGSRRFFIRSNTVKEILTIGTTRM